MYPRLYDIPADRSFFLFGPRGTGKSTWVRGAFPGAPVVDLLDAPTYRALLAAPERLEGMVPEKSRWIVVDEVQKVPELLDEVHRLIEARRWKFVLTGSSARKLRRGGANLLGGRALQRQMLPLTIWELGKDWNLRKALRTGLLPEAWTYARPTELLESYVAAYLKEEVFAEGLARNLGVFSRFLEMASFSQAQVLNVASLARDVGVDAKLAANHLDLLEDLLLSVRLPVFSRRAKRKLAAHPKFFFFDPGVFRTLRPRGPLDSDSELDGPALETLFLHHLRALGEFSRWDQQLFHWRTAEKTEVDFISYGALGLFAFELKRAPLVRDEDLAGLRMFRSDYPVARCYLLHGGPRRERRDGIELVPFEEALRGLPGIFGVPGPGAGPG